MLGAYFSRSRSRSIDGLSEFHDCDARPPVNDCYDLCVSTCEASAFTSLARHVSVRGTDLFVEGRGGFLVSFPFNVQLKRAVDCVAPQLHNRMAGCLSAS